MKFKIAYVGAALFAGMLSSAGRLPAARAAESAAAAADMLDTVESVDADHEPELGATDDALQRELDSLTYQTLGAPSVTAVAGNPWARVPGPTNAGYGPVGAYARGCIDGAQALPWDGPGYQAMRLSRRRYFGHSSLVAFLQGLGKSASDTGLGTILIGDMGQARGGPMPSGHASHQIGLDVDVWYSLNTEADRRSLTGDEREHMSADTLVDLRKWAMVPGKWRREHGELLRLAAERPEVERIFVNPVIKRELCQDAGRDRAWLRKIRPYYYHHDHFHVRLRCPKDAAHCAKQAAVPAGDGCGAELDRWYEPKHHFPPPAKPHPHPHPVPPGGGPHLPPLCSKILGF